MAASNRDLVAAAGLKLQGCRGRATVVLLIWYFWALLSFQAGVAGLIANLLVMGPLAAGVSSYFLSLARGEPAKAGQVFKGFSSFVNRFEAFLGIVFFTVLWAIFLIFPAIIALLSYSMTFFILAENPKMYATDAITLSKEMMRGNKKKLCCLLLRCILKCLPLIAAFVAVGAFWPQLSKAAGPLPIIFLCFLQIIGIIWIGPRLYGSMALFYEDIKGPFMAMVRNGEFVPDSGLQSAAVQAGQPDAVVRS